MKWVFYLVLLCAAVDIIVFQISIQKGDDVMFAGFFYLPIAVGVLYTGICVRWIIKKDMADKKPVLTYILLSPPVLYLFAHVFLPLLWLVKTIHELL